MPWTYRHVEASPGTCVVVRIAGEAGGDWSIVREAGRWRLATPTATPEAVVSYSADTAWKVATKRRSRDLVLATFDDIAIQGNREPGSNALDMISVMA